MAISAKRGHFAATFRELPRTRNDRASMTAHQSILHHVHQLSVPEGLLARSVLGFDRGHAGARTGPNCTARSPEGKPGWTARHAGPAGFSPGHRRTPELEEYIPVTQTDRRPLVPSSTMAKALTWISALSVLGTIIAVIVLTLSGNSDYLAPVIGLGAAAAATGGTVQVRIHVRR
jgi:hypothetical protein